MSPAASQGHTFDLLAGEEDLHEEAEEVVCEHPFCHFGVVKISNSSLWPPNLGLQFIHRQRRWVEQRRSRTTGDIVASEGKAVDEDRQDEGNSKGT